MWIEVPIRIVPAILPLVAWALLFSFARTHGRHWRESFVLSLVGWGVLIWTASELQSLMAGLKPIAALVYWLGITGFLLVVVLRAHRRVVGGGSDGSQRTLPIRDRAASALLLTLAGLSLTVALVAVVCPVMAWDALAYHLPRVFYWVQYGTIEPFPAANHRQLFMAPWPAFAQLQHYLLAGSDRLANLLQWLAMIASAITVSSIAQELGAGRRAQIVASAFALSIPMGVLQGSTSQTDYVVTCWLAVVAFYVFRRLGTSRFAFLDQLAMGAAVGLAVASKGTAIPIMIPFLAVYVVVELRQDCTASAGWRRVIVVGSVALLLNAPHMIRNDDVFGDPFAPAAHRQLVNNESFHPRYLISNLTRQAFAHLGTWNENHAVPLIAASDRLHEWLSIEDGDPVNSHKGQKLWIPPLSGSENTSGNPLHLLLYLFCAALLCRHLQRDVARRLVVFGLCLVSSTLLFCVLIKYQHSISRLHLPLFVLATPWAAAILGRYLPTRIVMATGWLLVLAAVPHLVFSEFRPLIGPNSIWRTPREQLQYRWGRSYEPAVKSIAERASKRNVTTLGLVSDGEMLEYHLWHALRDHYDTMPRLENVSPEGAGGADLALPSNLTSVQPFLTRFSKTSAPGEIQFLDHHYQRIQTWTYVPLSVYKRRRHPR